MKDTLEILIVDDDAVHRRAVRLNMAGWGYSVTEADDGEEAVRQARVRTFDLILMDIRMTKMSGLEALEQIKKIQPAVPVIIMTAYASV
ncbi:MAG TPA: response regulator, partial [Smithellaceae bacterium]|nr:response regulator [Smithellaceae bacterium]